MITEHSNGNHPKVGVGVLPAHAAELARLANIFLVLRRVGPDRAPLGAGLPTSPKQSTAGLLAEKQMPAEYWRPSVAIVRGRETRAQREVGVTNGT